MRAHRTPVLDWPEATWPSPDSARWSAEGLSRLSDELSRGGSTAFLIVAAGKPVFVWGDPTQRSSIASIRKSIVALLYGMEIEAGAIDLDATLGELGIKERAGLTETERGATVRDLLMARSGVYLPSVYDTADGRPARGAHAPGTHWFYNNWDFNALGSIYEKCTGFNVHDGFIEKLSLPLGLEDFHRADGFFDHGPESIHPVYKFKLSARDLARIGLFVLRGGLWCGKQLVSSTWINYCLAPHSRVAEGRAYGCLWWTAEAKAPGDPLAIGCPIAYASGFGGQYLILVPDLDLVIVHRSANPQQPVSHARMGELLRHVIAASDN